MTQPRQAGPPPRWRAGLRALVLPVLLALLATGCSQDVSIAPPRAPRDDSGVRADRAQQTLDRLVASLRDSGSGPATALAAPGDRALLAAVHANARSLGLTGVAMRYVDDVSGSETATEQEEYGAGSWVGSVDVSYRIPHYDTAATHLETAMVFVPSGRQVRIAAVGGHGDRSPSWLHGPLSIARSPRTLVLSADARRTPAYSRMARQAIRDVGKVLPGWRGSLVVEVPPDEGTLDSYLAADQEQYADIAAVTTSVDGSLVRGAPVHVFLNPRIFSTLKTKGAQVVMSHEATHVATGATFADMPEWLLEGFADYVALDHAGVPVQVAAHQILTRIRLHGLPTGLPTAADLQPTASGLGATYEEAWLANRFLGQRYGEAQLVRFYDAVSGGEDQAAAFRSVLGTTEQAFVVAWRDDLRGLAGR